MPLPPVSSLTSASTTPASPYVWRVVQKEEWPAMTAALPQYPTLPDPDFTILLVLTDTRTGGIVGSWMAMNTVELHGLYLDPTVRHHPAAAMALLSGMVETLIAAEIPVVVTRIEDAPIARLAQHAGFQELPGKIWKLSLGGT